MMLRTYFKNVSFLVIINFLVKPIWVFVIDRQFQLWLGQAAYGHYFVYLNMVYILSVILDLGLHNFAVKSISEDDSSRSEFISNLWLSKIILCAVYLVLVLILILVQGLTFYEGIVFLLVSIEMMIFSIYQFFRMIVQGLQFHREDSLLSSLDRIFLILIGGSILILWRETSPFGLTSYIGFHILAYLLSIFVALYYFRKEISFDIRSSHRIAVFKIIKAAAPLTLITLLMTIYTRMDAILVKYFLENGDVLNGSLAYSNRIIDSGYNALALFSVFLLPTVARHHLSELSEYARRVVLFSGIAVTGIALSFILGCLIFSEEIYAKLYPASTTMDIDVFQIQLWSILGVGWMYVFGSYLTATSRYRALIAIAIFGVLLSVLCNYVLLIKYQLIGSAYASSIVQISVGSANLFVAIYYLYYHRKSTAKTI
jgi:O-antigen/teichoic acid export membrane protein